MRKYTLFIVFLLLIPVYLFATDGVSTVEHPAKVNSVATPDKVNTVSGLAAGGGVCGIVGVDCSDNATEGADTYTYVSQYGAECSGAITKLQMYRESGTGTITFVLFTASGNDLTSIPGSTRQVTVTADDGCKEWNAPGDFVAITVNMGEYLGVYLEGNVENDNDWTSGSGLWYRDGDQTGCSGVTFDSNTNAHTAIMGEITS